MCVYLEREIEKERGDQTSQKGKGKKPIKGSGYLDHFFHLYLLFKLEGFGKQSSIQMGYQESIRSEGRREDRWESSFLYCRKKMMLFFCEGGMGRAVEMVGKYELKLPRRKG